MPSGRSMSASFSTWAISAASALAGLFGISGILYGVGFLVLRAHYSFLGIWGAVPSDATILAAEGGRFFYHLVFVAASPIIHLGDPKILGPILLLFLVFHIGRRGYKHWEESIRSHTSRLIELVPKISPTFSLLIILALTAIVFETIWIITEPNDVLRFPERLPANFCSQQTREDAYIQVVWRLVVGIVLGWFIVHHFWIRASWFQRVLIAAQWILIFAAVGGLPVAYGKFMLASDYPTVTHPLISASATSLLIGETSDFWITWNTTKKQTEILSHSGDNLIVIGFRQPLLP